MNRSVLFFGGLFATIALTVVVGEWIVPDSQVDPAFGLEVLPSPTASPTPEGTSGQQVGQPSPTPTPTATLAPTQQPTVSEGTKLRPTLNWVNVFSQNSELEGAPLPIGSVVEAFDPDGVLAGRFTVKQDGLYGLMPIYMDDPLTEVDEGADVGDELRFEINGLPAEVVGPDAPIWTGNGGLLQLDLTAPASAP